MRLIDSDELKRKLQSRHDNGNDDFDKGYNVGLGTAIDLIDCSPTIDIPIRYKGEWIEREQKTMGAVISYNSCSYCNMKQSIKWNFCPNCGAEMQKGDES